MCVIAESSPRGGAPMNGSCDHGARQAVAGAQMAEPHLDRDHQRR